jgi:hypothetical protein
LYDTSSLRHAGLDKMGEANQASTRPRVAPFYYGRLTFEDGA